MDSDEARATALVLPVPAAEPVVRAWRQRYDPVAQRGVPAHITLIYPFRGAASIDDATIADLARFFASVAPLPFALRRTGTFPGVLYLAPDPPDPFVTIIEALAARYPDVPPYRGVHATILPHLTVAQPSDPEEVGQVTAAFLEAAAATLPIAATATKAWLMEEDLDGSWRRRCCFPFRGSD